MTGTEISKYGSRIAVSIGALSLMVLERVSKSPGGFGIYLDSQVGVITNESRTGTLAALGWLVGFVIANNFIKDKKTSLLLGAVVPVSIGTLLIAHEINGFGGNGMNPLELAPFLLCFLGTICAVDLFTQKIFKVGE